MKAEKIVKEAIRAFKENINALTWLDDATRSEVLQKVDGMCVNIGYPDYMLNSTKIAKFLKKYEEITIKTETYFKNQLSISDHDQQRTLNEFRKRQDEGKWDLSPLDGDAQYNLMLNLMTFPAAILEPPIFFPNKTLIAYSLGSFGSGVGHEMIHGFGTWGRMFDKDGKRRNWWTKKSLQEFKKRIKCYEKQYSGYKILGKWPINAKDTAEENVADSGALKIALKTYYNWAKLNPKETLLLPGLNFTNEQLFYIGFAQAFCRIATNERRYQMSLNEHHADDKFRVNGPLTNSCEFAHAFKCKENSPMNPIKKCYLWSKEGPLV